MMELDDKQAVVTGGASGIGRAIGIEFAENGANVVIGDIQEDPRRDGVETTTVEEVRNRGRTAQFVKADVANREEAKQLIEEAIDEFGGLDILVNNAAVFPSGSIDTISPHDWQRTFDVNVTGIFNVTRAALPHLRNSEQGRIINLSSQLGLVGREEAAAYCASKGAVANLTRQMALDYADDEITVNAINPGIVKTSMTEEKLANPDQRETFEEYVPLPYFGEPEDIAQVAAFLASGASRYMTGHCLVVDGGYTVH